MESILDFMNSLTFWMAVSLIINIILLIIVLRLFRRKESNWMEVSQTLDSDSMNLRDTKSDREEINARLEALIQVTENLSYKIEKLDKEVIKDKNDKSELIIETLRHIKLSQIENVNMLKENRLEYLTQKSIAPKEKLGNSTKPDPAPPVEMETEEMYEEVRLGPKSRDNSDWGGSVPPDEVEMEELEYEEEGDEEFGIEEIGIPAMQPVVSDSVNFAGFSPSSMEPDSLQIIDIWAFTEIQFKAVKEIAKELDRDKITGYKSGLKIDRGTVIGIHLTSLSKTIHVENSTEAITWEGEKTNASFAITIDASAKIGKHILKATISVEGLSIATLLLNISVSETGSQEQQQCDGSFEKINSAFASYASENRAQVLARIQGIKKVQPDMEIFLDVLTLRSGENWENKLTEHVPNKDKFYLFWSKPASESLWVEREWKLALEKRGLSYIDPVPLDEPSDAPPPHELSSLHFNDAYMTYAKYYESKQA